MSLTRPATRDRTPRRTPCTPARAPLPRQRPAEAGAESVPVGPVAAPAAPPVIPVPVPQAPPPGRRPDRRPPAVAAAGAAARTGAAADAGAAVRGPAGAAAAADVGAARGAVAAGRAVPAADGQHRPAPGHPAPGVRRGPAAAPAGRGRRPVVAGRPPSQFPPTPDLDGPVPGVPHQPGPFQRRHAPTGQFPAGAATDRPVPGRAPPAGPASARPDPDGPVPGRAPPDRASPRPARTRAGPTRPGSSDRAVPTGQFPAGPHLGVPSQAGPQMYPPHAGLQQPPYTGPPYPPQPHPGHSATRHIRRRSRRDGPGSPACAPPCWSRSRWCWSRRRRRSRSRPCGGPDRQRLRPGRRPGRQSPGPGQRQARRDRHPEDLHPGLRRRQGQAGAHRPGRGAAQRRRRRVRRRRRPVRGPLRDDLTRRFNSLRQLQVKVWEPTVLDAVKVGGDNTADVIVYVRYCYVVTTCDPMNLETKTKWNVTADGVKLLEFGVAEDLGPRPWERSELRVAVGKRVVMATTPKYASRLTTMLVRGGEGGGTVRPLLEVEPAAVAVRRLPGRTGGVVHLVRHKQESWVAGFALPLTADATEIVLNANRVDVKETLDVLRHEFTHVVTLAERVPRLRPDVVAGRGHRRVRAGAGPRWPLRRRRLGAQIRAERPLEERDRDGRPAGGRPPPPTSAAGTAWRTWPSTGWRSASARRRCSSSSTGPPGRATRLEEAAMKVYGVSWDDVATDCVKYVRNHS